MRGFFHPLVRKRVKNKGEGRSEGIYFTPYGTPTQSDDWLGLAY